MQTAEVIESAKQAFQRVEPAIEKSLQSKVFNTCSYFLEDARGEVIQADIINSTVHAALEYVTSEPLGYLRATFDLVGSIYFEAEIKFFDTPFEDQSEWAEPPKAKQVSVYDLALFQGQLTIRYPRDALDLAEHCVRWSGPEQIGVSIADVDA